MLTPWESRGEDSGFVAKAKKQVHATYYLLTNTAIDRVCNVCTISIDSDAGDCYLRLLTCRTAEGNHDKKKFLGSCDLASGDTHHSVSMKRVLIESRTPRFVNERVGVGMRYSTHFFTFHLGDDDPSKKNGRLERRDQPTKSKYPAVFHLR